MRDYLDLTKDLLQEFDRSKSEYCSLTIGDFSLKLKKSKAETPGLYENRELLDPASQKNLGPAASLAPDQDLQPQAGAEGLEVLTSPLVGVFYQAPEPGAPPFVKEGDRVDQETTLGILESMKMMNEIKAPGPARVAKICVSNEDFIAFGQELFYLEPLDD